MSRRRPGAGLYREVQRLDREAKNQVVVASVHCAQHGPQYACSNSVPGRVSWKNEHLRSCAHIACRQINAGHCPECETP